MRDHRASRIVLALRAAVSLRPFAIAILINALRSIRFTFALRMSRESCKISWCFMMGGSVVNDQIIPRRPRSAHTWDGAAAGTPVAVLFFTHTRRRVARSEAQTKVMGFSRGDPQIIAHHQRHLRHVTKSKKKTWAPPQVLHTIQPYLLIMTKEI